MATEDQFLEEEPQEDYLGLTPSLQAAMISQESGGDPFAESGAGAKGLMQVTDYMWNAYGGQGKDPYDPDTNVDIGSKIYSDEYTRFGGNTDLALAAYNAGSPAVIRAMGEAGFSLKDAQYVQFDDIAPYLPEETRDYVPSVLAKSRSMSNSQDTVDTSYDPIETVGSAKELATEIGPIISDPKFMEKSTNEKLKTINDVYRTKKAWTKDAKTYLGDMVSSVWDAAPPNEKINYGEIVGAPPKVTSPETADQELADWRKQKLDDLQNLGIDPIFLGTGLNDYFSHASEYEKRAAEHREKLKSGGISDTMDFVKAAPRGFASGILSTFTAIPRVVFGADETADYIESAADVLPEVDQFVRNEAGYVQFDEYGKPVTRGVVTAGQATGDALSLLTGGMALKFFGAGPKALSRFMLGTNLLKTSNDAYKDALDVGGTRGEALAAALFSTPSAFLDTLGDTAVLGGGKAWIGGLSPFNKARAIATGVMIKAPIEGITEAGQQFMQDIGTSIATGQYIPTPQRMKDALIGGFAAGGIVGGITTAMDLKEGAPFVREEGQPPPPEGSSNLPGLPPPPERKLLPAPETQEALPGRDPNQRALPLPLSGQNLPAVQESRAVTAYDVPNPDEQVRLAEEFQHFQESQDFARLYHIRSPKDVDGDLLRLFGLQGVFTEDGNLQVNKVETHIPPDPKNLAPEGIEDRISNLTQELATAPKPEEVDGYVARRREILQEFAPISQKAKANAAAVQQLNDRSDMLKKRITRLKQERDSDGANERLVNAQLSDARAELRDVNGFLAQNPEGAKAAKLNGELRVINNNISQLTDPRFMNNIKAKERELTNLLTTRDIATTEQAAATTAKKSAEDTQALQKENLQRGVGIETENGTRYVLPLEGKWYVLSDRGNPMTKGFQNFQDAVDVGRQIVDLESTRGVTPRVNAVTRAQTERPYRFKQRIEVPFYIVTPGPKVEETKTSKKTEKVPVKGEEAKKASAAKKSQKVAKKIKLTDENDVPLALRSKTTKSVYSDAIEPDLRRLTDHWISGFKAPETVVGTFAEYESGALDSVLSPAQKEWAERAREKFNTADGAATVTSDGKGIILLRSGKLDYDSARIASHELGHVVKRSVFESAPQAVKDQVYADYKAAAESFDENAPVSEIAAALYGPDSAFEGDERPFNTLDPKEQEYLISKSKGFEEFLANQVSEFALNPDKKAASGAPSLYKKIADAFRKIWGSLKNTFKVSDSFQDWLNDQFDADATRETFAPKKEVPQAKIPKGEKERKFTKRVRTSEEAEPEVREAVGTQTYTPKSSKALADEMRKRIDPNNIDKSIKEVTDFSTQMPYQERVAYGMEVMKELNRQLQAAKTAGQDPSALIEKEADLVSRMAEEGTRLGQGVQAFALFPGMSYEGMVSRFEKDLKKMTGNKDAVLSDALKEKLRGVHDRMQAVKAANPNADTADNVVLNSLGMEAVGLVKDEIPQPFTRALSYYWYMNILSGLSTQSINVFGSGHNLFLRGLATALTQPKGFPSFLDGLSKGVSKGLEGAAGVMRGRTQTRLGPKYEGLARGTKPPTWEAQNALVQKLIADPINFFNKNLEIVAKLMNAADTFFYETGSEGQAYLATYNALKKGGVTPQNMGAKIAEELHSAPAEWTSAETQAKKEWGASGTKFTPRDVALRAYEIIDQKRDVGLQERAHRFGEITTFTEKPQGVFGEIAKLLDAAVQKIPVLRIQFPFIHVVSNVLSQSLDYTPIGAIRAAAGKHINDVVNSTLKGQDLGPRFDPEERLQRLGSSIIGMALTSGVLALVDGYLDDEDPKFAIYARGPQNKGQAEALAQKGWAPYSIKIGDTYIKYSETMLAPMFAWMGELHDAYRYSPAFNKKNPGDKFVYGLARMSGVVLDMGFLRGVSRVWDAMRGEGNPKEIVLGPLRGLVPFSGLLRDLGKSIDTYQLDPRDTKSSIVRGIPFIQSYAGKPALNGFGEPIETNQLLKDIPALSHLITPVVGRFVSPQRADPTWNWMAERGLYVPQMGTQTSVGITNATPKEQKKIKANEERRAEELGRAAYDTLTYEEIYDLTKLSGPKIRKGVEKLMKKNLKTNEDYQKEIGKLVQEARREAKVDYFNY